VLERTMNPATLASLILVNALSFGCATGFTYITRRENATPIREFRPHDAPIQGQMAGTVKLDGRSYLRVYIPEAGRTCKAEHKIDLLLPESTASDAVAIVRDSVEFPSPSHDSIVIFDQASARAPIHVNQPYSPILKADIVEWLTSLPEISEGPNPIVVLYTESDEPLVAFRPMGQSARVVPIREEHLSWRCRSRTLHAATLVLFVPAAAFDIATSPIQLLLFLLSVH